MEITKARLKQIIMEEIQKFIVAEEDDITPEEEEAAKEILKSDNNYKLFKVGDFKELSKYILLTKLKNKKKKINIDKRFDFYTNLENYRKIIMSVL